MTALPRPGGPPPAPDLTAFVAAHGRLPRLGDTPAPWHYRGWLLPYVIQLHALIPAVGDRGGYHLRTLEAGRLLDEPIPQIAFGPPGNKILALLHDWSRLVGRDCGGCSVFLTLLEWLCSGLALSDEQPGLSDKVSEKLYRQVDLTPLLERPHDYLGEYFATSKARGWNPTGFYPTPHNVVECMVRMVMQDAGNRGRIATMNTTEITRERLQAVVHEIRDVLWLVGDTYLPDKQWGPETPEDIADILAEAGLKPGPNEPAQAAGRLDDERQRAAEDAFAHYDRGDAVVADTCGWVHASGDDEWSRGFFVEEPNGPSVRERFVVRFQPGSAEVEGAYGSC